MRICTTTAFILQINRLAASQKQRCLCVIFSIFEFAANRLTNFKMIIHLLYSPSTNNKKCYTKKTSYPGDCPSGKAFWEHFRSFHPPLAGLVPCSRSLLCQNPPLKYTNTVEKCLQIIKNNNISLQFVSLVWPYQEWNGAHKNKKKSYLDHQLQILCHLDGCQLKIWVCLE